MTSTPPATGRRASSAAARRVERALDVVLELVGELAEERPVGRRGAGHGLHQGGDDAALAREEAVAHLAQGLVGGRRGERGLELRPEAFDLGGV